jgi:hypothetical protein
MRTTSNQQENVASLIDDLPNGGCLIQGCCTEVTVGNCLEKGHWDQPLYCPKCLNEIFYAEWHSW